MAQLQKLGLKTVPVLSRGDKYIFGQNTQQIIDFVGLNEDGGPQLSVDELNARVDKFMHHMAADIAGAASDQDRHYLCPRMLANISGRP